MNRRLAALEKCTLFHHKNADEIAALLANIACREEAYEENDVILSPVQKANRIGIILSGTVDVQKIFPNGKVVIIERKQAFEMIGDSSIFSHYEYCPDTVCACKPTKILFVSKADLLQLFQADQSLMLNYLESTSNSTLLLKHKIGLLSLDSIQEKIAGYLVYSLQDNDAFCRTNTISLPFSKKAWAEYMDVSRTSLSRELRKLETEGILTFEKRTITVVDFNRLNRILSL